MNLTIVSNLVMDTILGEDGIATESIGGPPCYAGFTATNLGFTINIVTRFGKDLKEEYTNILNKRGITLGPSGMSILPTTKFLIQTLGRSRMLSLESNCDKIRLTDVEHIKTDGWLVSPVLNEVPEAVLEYIRNNPGKKSFVMLDPQGFTRMVDPFGMIVVKNETHLNLKNISAIKLDTAELGSMTGGVFGLSGIKKIHTHYGVKFVIHTEEGIIHVSDANTHFWLNLPHVQIPDSTGIGDIISSAFSCTFMRENDVVWAFCFAVGAAAAAIDSKCRGVEKIPRRSKVEENASYYYNTLKYEKL
ncbi:MAG TPA: PfkB family carbohydrate kinase [Nitrososphaeraceae archaeon]|nr:PfkB family carbohydrate kinase [Nitrososphaeraceae archaeon]